MKKSTNNFTTNFTKNLLTFYAIIIANAMIISCNNPVMLIEPEKIITPDEPEEEIIIVTIKPIEVYEKYAVDENNKVFGLTGKTREAIVLKDSDDKIHPFQDFFKVGDKIYFAVVLMEGGDPEAEPPVPDEPVTHFFSQTNGTVKEETSLPVKPEPDFVEMGISPFAIQTYDYEGMDTSRVSKDGKPTGFKMIDNYFSTPVGLWFSVTETISIRLKGVYFYPVVGNLSQSPVMSGRIW